MSTHCIILTLIFLLTAGEIKSTEIDPNGRRQAYRASQWDQQAMAFTDWTTVFLDFFPFFHVYN